MRYSATLAALLALLAIDSALAAKHKFAEGDKVTLWANKVGPFSSPSETYQYYDLPFCQPEEKDSKLLTLGEVVDGNRMVATPYKVDFKQAVEKTTLCTRQLDEKDLKAFRHAIQKDYYFQFYYDDLPIWGLVGRVEEEVKGDANSTAPRPKRLLLFTHVNFDVAYNGDRVIEVGVSTDPAAVVDVSEGVQVPTAPVEFTYSVSWRESTLPFASRMDKYRKYQFLRQHLEIHWFSIINSCVTVLLLTGFLTTILMRVLRADFVKYARDEEDPDEGEEAGWKLVHGDVFRFPKRKALLAAFVGAGTQLLVLSVCVLSLALLGAFRPYSRGAMFTALILLYVLTSGIAGFTSVSYYRQWEGASAGASAAAGAGAASAPAGAAGAGGWVRALLLTGLVFFGPLFIVFCVNNSIAIAYGSTAALPVGTILVIAGLWLLVTVPLLAVGGVLGKNHSSRASFAAPCRTNKYPREVPELPWYRSTPAQMLMAGFLPFSAIYIELFYIFASVWGHKVYTIYSILFIVFAILLLVTAFITVALTYFQLAAEDHRWWWRSFLCGGSTGLFIYGYCFYYYAVRSDMGGLLQASFYFGYNACVCFGFFLMLGFVGWRASLAFVRRIYRAIKCE